MTRYYAGNIVHFETGEYSDRSSAGLLVCLKDVDLDALALKWRAEMIAAAKLEPGYHNEKDPDSFLGWLCANQLMAQLDCHGLHIGSYRRLSFGKTDFSTDFDDEAQAAND